MTEELEGLREKDRAVLRHISQGRTDTHQITQATTLEAHEVRYSLKKLEELELIILEKPDGMVERVVDGQKRKFKAPLKAELTGKGPDRLAESQDDTKRYRDMSKEELANKVLQLEEELQNLQHSFYVFRKQLQRKIN